jgi:hypothetical protein
LEGVALGVRIGKGGVREVGERGALEAERFDDPFAVQLTDGFAGHLFQDETEKHRVGVGILPLGAGIEQWGPLMPTCVSSSGLPTPGYGRQTSFAHCSSSP